MAESDGMIVFAGQYDDVEEAKLDFQGLQTLKDMDFVGKYEAALFMKEEGGKVKILDTDSTTRARSTLGGAATGAILGLIFPVTLVAGAAVGAAGGAFVGEFSRSLKRSDINAMGEMLDAGQAGIVFVGEATLEEGLRKLMKRTAKELKVAVDQNADEIKRAIDAAADQV